MCEQAGSSGAGSAGGERFAAGLAEVAADGVRS